MLEHYDDMVYPLEPIVDEHKIKCAECSQDIPDEVHDYLCADCRTGMEIDHITETREAERLAEEKDERIRNKWYTDDDWEAMRQAAMKAGYEQAINR
jgi:DNA-directed RNA polymerase subunit RPC12/RpoP